MRYIFFLLILLSQSATADWRPDKVAAILKTTVSGRNAIDFVNKNGVVIRKYEYIKGTYRRKAEDFREYDLFGQCSVKGLIIRISSDMDDVDAAGTFVHEVEHSRHQIKKLGLSSVESEYKARVEDILFYVEIGNLGYHIEDREYFKNECIVKVIDKYFMNETALERRMKQTVVGGEYEYGPYKYGKYKEVVIE